MGGSMLQAKAMRGVGVTGATGTQEEHGHEHEHEQKRLAEQL
jgi:hypothetical protein